MLESILQTTDISFIFVFIEGILSFFSPCILPLLPVYIGFLAGNAKKEGEDGVITYERKKVFLHTVFFVLGISFSFFILGMAFTTLGNFFNAHKVMFTRIGGILIVLLGLFQLGFFQFSFLQKERRIPFSLSDKEVNPFIALILGFTFSFAWTPCIGPALSSVLIMASGARTAMTGNLLVLLYTLGFILPFLLVGLFTTQVLGFLKSKQRLLKYAIKAGGVILIIMGVMMFTGWMNGVSSYLNSFVSNEQTAVNDTEPLEEEEETEAEQIEEEETEAEETEDEEKKDSLFPAYDFTLTDQYGNQHKLSDYEGKVVFLNFWATWCPPCKKEMPHIEELYEEYNFNEDEVVILGVANPSGSEYPNNQDVEKEEIISFLEADGYTFPTVFDETGELFKEYGITAFPTTFMIDKEGNVLGYVPGMMTKEMMKNIIDQTLQSSE